VNRRDAVKALMGLPAVASLSMASFKPTDVVVVEFDEWLPSANKLRAYKSLQEVWPNNRIIILDGGSKLKVVPGV